MGNRQLRPWHVQATNLPEHADNPIHTDAGGRAAGFPGALVAGVTIYAYLTHPPADGWGMDWVRSGGSEVRFHSPVLADDLVDLVPVQADDGWTVEARVGGDVRATSRVLPADGAIDDDGTLAVGEKLETISWHLDDEAVSYGRRAGDDLTLYDEHGVVHPALWPSLANRVVHRQVARGSWIHTRSRIRHLGAAEGTIAEVSATVVRRFDTRAGERAVLDVVIRVQNRLIARIEHEALVALR